MKKIICLALTLFILLTVFASCDLLPSDTPETESSSVSDNTENTESGDNSSEAPTEPDDSSNAPTESEDETDSSEKPDDPVDTPERHTYIDFTNSEKSLFNSAVGFVIPFIANDNYFAEEYTYDNESGVNFYTFGNTQAEFDAYRALFSSYTYEGSDVDEYGDTWYFYSNGDVYIDLSYYYYENEYVVDVYVYVINEDGGNQGGGDGGDVGDGSEHIYTDFTSDEKSLFNSTVGFVIPFLPNSQYYVEEYTYENEIGVNFYTFGNTQAEFDAYRALFSSYTDDGSNVDEYGDTWYFYSKGDVLVDMTFYYYEGQYVADIYVYIEDGSGGGNVTEPTIDYGTLNNPVTTTYAYNVCAGLAKGESSANPFYIKGTVTKIGETGKYYKNVYFTDGNTEMLIYTINMGDGITGFEVGDTITAYGYVKNYDGIIEMATYNGSVYVYVVQVEDSGEQGGGDVGGGSEHIYTDFTSDEKSLFNEYFGFVIPFIANSQYYVEEYTYEDEVGINFYTFGNTQAEFNAYRALFSSYINGGTYEDSYGDTWYCYSKGDIYVDMSFYDDGEGNYVVDVYIYVLEESFEGEGGGSVTDPDVDLITNEGAGLPESPNGIYDVDFTLGELVQNVTDQGYYIDGCPTVGSPAVLVIPIEFVDVTAQSKGYTIENLEKIFNGSAGDTNYYSVRDYFFISSYGQLQLDITVVDTWFRPANSSSYYENATYSYYGEEMEIGDQLILNEALAYLSTIMDLSEFDSDSNGIIDAVVLVNTLDIGDDNFHWAYRYWNIYTDDEGYYYEYDEVSANDYLWISYEFCFEGYDDNGEVNYDKTNPLNPYTFIHEFSHALGSDDYYDTEYLQEPLGGCDVMDAMVGDHNPYTKFNYGWITTSKLIVTDSSVTVNLEAFSKNGDTVIIANNWNEALGAYQEYYVIMYYTGTELNSGEGGYFARDGIVVYHVNSSLYAEEYDGETYYDVYNTNTSASSMYGTEDNLIEFVLSAADTYTYIEGDTLPTVTDDQGNELCYTFVVDSITSEYATLTFTRK